jgi:CheY-like chemotaxis protein
MGKRKKRILLVEDNDRNRTLEKDLLEVAGFEVLEAVDAASGFAMAKKERPDLIVMDVRLPDARGTEIARKLRSELETCNIPIIFVTASVITDGLDEIEALKKFGSIGFISKPINTRTFALEIEQYLT